MRFPFLLVVALLTASCQLVYKLPTRQGNVIEQKQLDQLAVGMTKEQVKFLLGTPLAASPYRDDRWDYLGYYKSPRGQVLSRTVTLHFGPDQTLARMEGIQVANAANLDTPDVRTVIEQEKKDATERTREESEQGKDSGVVISPQQP